MTYTVKVRAILGDISKLNQHYDVIVNAANKYLIPGGGVDGALNQVAGPELKQAMADAKETNDIETGSAVTTLAYNLDADYVIHAVGPRYNGNRPEESEYFLKKAYEGIAREVEQIRKQNFHENKIQIAVPILSAGIYRYPLTLALKHGTEALINSSNYDMGGSDLVVSYDFVIFDDGRNPEQASLNLDIANDIIRKVIAEHDAKK